MKFKFKIFKQIVNTLFKLFFSILLFLIFIFSIFIVVFNIKKNEIILKAVNFTEYKIDAQLNSISQISIPEFNVKGDKIILFFPSIKITNQDLDILIKNLDLNLKYLPLLIMKLDFAINIKSVDLIKKVAKKMTAEGALNDWRSYLKSFSFDIQKISFIDLTSKDQINVDFYNINLNFYKKKFFQNDGMIFLQGNIFDDLPNSNLIGKCELQNVNKSCHFSLFDIRNKNISTVFKFFQNSELDKQFTFIKGDLKHLFIQFNESSKKSELNFFINFENLKVKIPSFKFKKDLEFEDLFLTVFKNKDTQIFFNASFDDLKKATGMIKLKSKTSEVEVFANNLTSEDLYNYWPKRYLKNLSDWIDKSIYDAKIPKVLVRVNSPMQKPQDLIVDVELDGASLKYSSYLPDLKNLKGRVFVNNTPDVLIDIKEGEYNNTKLLPNGVAIFNTRQNKLSLDLSARGFLKDFIKIFIPNSQNSSIINENFLGDSLLKLKLDLFTNDNNQDVFYNTNFDANIEVENIQTPLFKGKNTSFKISKNFQNLISSIKLTSHDDLAFYSSCTPKIDDLFFDLFINLNSGDIKINNFNVHGKDVDILFSSEFNYNAKNFFQSAVIKWSEFCGTRLSGSLNNNLKLIDLNSEVLSLQDIYSLGLYSFIKEILNHNKEKISNDFFQYDIIAKIKNLNLLKNVKMQDVMVNFATLNQFNISSNFINAKRNNEHINIEISNLGNVIKGFFGFEDLRNGTFKLNTKRNSNGEEVGKFEIKKYSLKLKDMDFSSMNARGDIVIDKTFFNIKNFYVANPKNTLNINGTIKKESYDLNLNASYTLSTLDINNYLKIIPIDAVSKIFNVLTFDALKDGIITLDYLIMGDIKNPKVQFQRSKTSKKIFTKTGKIILGVVLVNVVILPLIGFVLI